MNTDQKPRLHLTRRPKEFKERSLYPILPPPERALSIHVDLLIAALPLYLLSVYHYGFRPITLALISAVMMMGLDIAVKTVLKKEARFDISPAVSGVIVALFFPASSPLWLPIMTSVFATAVKVGLSYLPRIKLPFELSFSPIAVSLILSHLLFPGIMNVIPEVGQKLDPFAFSLESFKVISSSPLDKVISGFLPDTTTFETFFGLSSARIGEISGLLLIVVFLYLLSRHAAKFILPLTFILTVGVFAYLNPSLEAASDFIAFGGAIYNIFGSNTFLCAVFLMSRPEGSAKTPLGTAICGVIGGLTAMLLRGHVSVGLTALTAVLLIDIIAPVVDIFLKPIPFGGNLAPQTEDNKSE